MRNLKKVLALVIAFSMMLSAVAFAGYKDVAADADYAGAVELLSALGIFEGDENGNFNPDKTVSRAEMAAIICRATGVDAAAQTATDYSDVPASHWASGYIAHASDAGILNGVGGGLFNPAGTLTYQQALKIVVYALGFELMAEDNGGWSAGSIYVANRYKITEGADSTATRGNLAVILANAMKTPMMDKTSYGSDAKFEILNGKNDKDYRTLLTDMDIYIATGVVGAKDVDEIAFEVTEDSDDFEFEDGDKPDFKIGASDIAAYQHQNVDAYVKKVGKKYEVVAVVANAAGETLTILSDDVADYDKATGELEYYVDAANSNKTKTIDVANTITIEYNKAKYANDLDTLVDLDDVIITFIENTSDGDYDMVVAKSYTSCRVEDVDADSDKLFLVDGTIKFDFDAVEDGEVTRILADEEGNALTLADFAKDDVVAYIANGSIKKAETTYIEIIKLANSAVTGSVDSTYTSNGDKYVVIDGNDYIDTTGDLKAGDEGTFYIGITGKVIEYDATLAGENYGYIVEGAIAQGSFSADKWQIKILTKDDGVVTYDIADKYHDEVVKYLTTNAAVYEGRDLDAKEPVDGTYKSGAFDIIDDKFLWEDAADEEKADEARLITFETNSKGEIKELVAAEGSAKSFDKEYNADAQAIGNYALEDDVVIFVVGEADIDDIKAADISFLVDEGEYVGYAFRNLDSEYAAVVITESEAAYNVEAGFAIVTQIADSTDEEGNPITEVSYVQDETEGKLTFSYNDATVADKNGVDRELKLGDAFMFTADANGLVDKYIIVAEVTDAGDFKVLVTLNTVDGEENVAADLGKDTQIVAGYIYNTKQEKRNGRDVIFTDYAIEDGEVILEDTYSVLASSYKYTYNAAGRKTKIVSGDYTDDVEYREDFYKTVDGKEVLDKFNVAPVLFRIVGGKVVDVYASTVAQTKTIVAE